MISSSKKGFTLIELLVVVAIIGILASIVLVSLNSARAKGRDASAKGSMSSARAAAEIYYDNNGGTYSGMCPGGGAGDAGVLSLMDAAQSETGNVPSCEEGNGGLSYAIAIQLNNGNGFCVDSTGFAGDFASDGSQVDPNSTNATNGGVCNFL